MNILAIDTVTPLLSVAAAGPSGTVALEIDSGSSHAERIVEAIDHVVSLSGFSARETELVCVPSGPGSFTGLRLAWSAGRAIQLASVCRVCPIPPLECYAYPFREWRGAVLSVIDAKKHRFYIQCFRRGTAINEPLDLDAARAASLVDEAERILITGPDAEFFAEEFSRALPVSDVTVIPNGGHGMALSYVEFANSGRVQYTKSIPDHDGPVYVRKSDAEENYSGHRNIFSGS